MSDGNATTTCGVSAAGGCCVSFVLPGGGAFGGESLWLGPFALSATFAVAATEGLLPFPCGIGIVAPTIAGPTFGSGFVFGVWLPFFAPIACAFTPPLAPGIAPELPAFCGAVARLSVTIGATVTPPWASPLVPGLPVEVDGGALVPLDAFEPEFGPAFELEFDAPLLVPALSATLGSKFPLPTCGAFAGAGACCCGDGGVVGAVVVGGGTGAIGAVASRRAAKG